MELKLKTLLSYMERLNALRDIKEVLKLLSDLSKEILGVERCSIFLLEGEELWSVVAHGVDEIRLKVGEGLVGYVAKTKRPLIVNEPYKDKRFKRDVDERTGFKTKNALTIPLFNREDKLLGVFQALNKLSGNFKGEDLKVFNLVGNYISSTLENKILEDKLKRAYEETVRRLSYVAEFKDVETYAHVVRIGHYSKKMGELLGLSNWDCYSLYLASPMHDIGKVGIPDSILLKAGKLNEREWEIMKRHTIIGYKILKGSENEILKRASLIALEHHERWDGKGYPYKKKGEEISLWARITTLGDVFDALLSKRPYKEPWDYQRTYEYIRENLGKIFDPNLGEIFLKNYEKFIKIWEEYRDEEVNSPFNF